MPAADEAGLDLLDPAGVLLGQGLGVALVAGVGLGLEALVAGLGLAQVAVALAGGPVEDGLVLLLGGAQLVVAPAMHVPAPVQVEGAARFVLPLQVTGAQTVPFG